VKTPIDRLAGLAVLLCLALGSPPALAQARPADEIIKELDATVMPIYDVNRDSPNTRYREEFIKQRDDARRRRAALIGELHHSYPDHPAVADLLPERWETLFNLDEDYDGVLKETDGLLKSQPDHTIARYAWQWRAMCSIRVYSRADSFDQDRFLAAIEDFINRYQDDTHGPDMLYDAAAFHISDQEKSVAVLRRIVAEWPTSGSARQARWKLRQADGVGKPFELEFKDALSGKEMSIESLRGKIVVIDFWATWSPPCVAEVPHLKELYAMWRSQGVEFIGVSLDSPEDQGGLDDLKKFVSEHGITWPQYYPGQGWQSDFSTNWGIDSIPCVFIVDHEGNLATANVGKKLVATVDALIAKRDGTAKAADAGDGG